MLNFASVAISSMPAAAQAATQQRVKFEHMATVTAATNSALKCASHVTPWHVNLPVLGVLAAWQTCLL
jgi:hypothetical protein